MIRMITHLSRRGRFASGGALGFRAFMGTTRRARHGDIRIGDQPRGRLRTQFPDRAMAGPRFRAAWGALTPMVQDELTFGRAER